MSDGRATSTLERVRPAPPNLWRDRDFVRFWVGQTASQLGAQTSQVTVPLIAVVGLGAGAGQVGLLRAAQQAPVLLLSLFVGVWVDRWRARSVMVLADFGRALALALIPIAYLFGLLDVRTLCVDGFFVGVFTVSFDVAYQACLLRMIGRDQLVQGNGMLESSRSAAQIGGPALGGGLVSLLTAPIAVVASAFFFALSFLSIRRIRRPEPAVRPAGPRPGTLRQIREGLGFVARNATLRTVGATTAFYNISFSALMTVYLLFLVRTLHLPGAVVGLSLAAMGPGSLVGSLVSTWLPRRFGYGMVLVSAALIADGLMLCLGGLHGSGAVTVALLITINFFFSVFSQTVNVGIMAVRQAVTPNEMQGRVSATIRFVGMGLTPLGSLLGGYLGGQLGLRTSMWLTALGLCLSPLCLILSPLARLGSTLPAEAELRREPYERVSGRPFGR